MHIETMANAHQNTAAQAALADHAWPLARDLVFLQVVRRQL
jgi:hypothetical protein